MSARTAGPLPRLPEQTSTATPPARVARRVALLTHQLERAERVAGTYERTHRGDRNRATTTALLRASVEAIRSDLAYWQDLSTRLNANPPATGPGRPGRRR